MRTFMKIAAAAGALLCSVAVTQAQSGQQSSTEAGTSFNRGYSGAYAQYGGHYYHHHHHYRR